MEKYLKFETPIDYLYYVQKMYSKSYPRGTASSEFEMLTRQQASNMNIEIVDDTRQEGLHHVIEGITKKVFSSIDNKISKDIIQNIAIGLLPTGKANAFIIKSEDEKYAVVISSGLMLLLHKYFKLVRAYSSPKDIIFCNRKDASLLEKKDINVYILNLIKNYCEFNVPYGTMIKLSDDANFEHSILLALSEIFILCHELGHYLNGDLSNLNNYLPLENEIGSVYIENKDHEIEYCADVTGYKLYQKCLERMGFHGSPLDALKPILATFNLLFAIGGGESKTHPHPYDRAVNIVNKCYSNNLANSLREALLDPDLLPNLLKV